MYCETTDKIQQRDGASEDEIESLQVELQSLYPEIAPLAEMSAQQDHVHPTLSEISRNGKRVEQENAAKLEHASQHLEASPRY